jgi:hypothetical protein
MKSLTEFATLDEYMQQVIKPRLSHIKKKKKDAKERLAALKRDMLLAEKELEDSREELEQERSQFPAVQFDKFEKAVAELDWGQALILPSEKFEFINKYLSGVGLEDTEEKALAKHVSSFMDENGLYFFAVEFERRFYPTERCVSIEDYENDKYTLVLCTDEDDLDFLYVNAENARHRLDVKHFDDLYISLSKSYRAWEEEVSLGPNHIDTELIEDTDRILVTGVATLDWEVFGIAKWK